MARALSKDPPATTIIATSTPGFIMPESRIEINVIALARDGATRKEVVPGPALFDGTVAAIRCGDLLFLSGLMAIENGRLAPEARIDERQPFYGIPVKAELAAIIRQADEICRAAGTSIRNAVRIQQFHTDLADTRARDRGGRGASRSPARALRSMPWVPVPATA